LEDQNLEHVKCIKFNLNFPTVYIIILMIQTKLFSDLYLVKFLNISAFFPVDFEIMKIGCRV